MPRENESNLRSHHFLGTPSHGTPPTGVLLLHFALFYLNKTFCFILLRIIKNQFKIFHYHILVIKGVALLFPQHNNKARRRKGVLFWHLQICLQCTFIRFILTIIPPTHLIWFQEVSLAYSHRCILSTLSVITFLYALHSFFPSH
jgi:hypothetical protein